MKKKKENPRSVKPIEALIAGIMKNTNKEGEKDAIDNHQDSNVSTSASPKSGWCQYLCRTRTWNSYMCKFTPCKSTE